MEKWINLLVFVSIGIILFSLFRLVFILFWEVNKARKTWLWSFLDYLDFYTKFKFRWFMMGSNSMPKENAKILYWNFSDPQGPSYGHRYSKHASKLVKAYIEDVFA